LTEAKRIDLILRTNEEMLEVKENELSDWRQDNECIAIRNFLFEKDGIIVRASIITKHLAVKEEEGDKLLVNKMFNLGI